MDTACHVERDLIPRPSHGGLQDGAAFHVRARFGGEGRQRRHRYGQDRILRACRVRRAFQTYKRMADRKANRMPGMIKVGMNRRLHRRCGEETGKAAGEMKAAGFCGQIGDARPALGMGIHRLDCEPGGAQLREMKVRIDLRRVKAAMDMAFGVETRPADLVVQLHGRRRGGEIDIGAVPFQGDRAVAGGGQTPRGQTEGDGVGGAVAGCLGGERHRAQSRQLHDLAQQSLPGFGNGGCAFDHAVQDRALDCVMVAAAGPGHRQVGLHGMDGDEMQGPLRREHGGMADQGRRDIDMRERQGFHIDPGCGAAARFGRQRSAQPFHFRRRDPADHIMVVPCGKWRPRQLRIGDAQPDAACIAKFDLMRVEAAGQRATQAGKLHLAAGCVPNNPFDGAVAGRRPQQQRNQQCQSGGDAAGPDREPAQEPMPLRCQKACPNPI